MLRLYTCLVPKKYRSASIFISKLNMALNSLSGKQTDLSHLLINRGKSTHAFLHINKWLPQILGSHLIYSCL